MRSKIQFAAALGAVLLSSAMAQSQEAASSRPVDTVETGWQVLCRPIAANRPQLSCTTLYEMASALDRTPVLSIQVAKENAATNLVIGLPLGMDVRNGVEISGAGFEKFRIPITTCTANGCVARAEIADKTISQWRVGKTLVVEFGHANGGKFRSDISLAGFDLAYARSERL